MPLGQMYVHKSKTAPYRKRSTVPKVNKKTKKYIDTKIKKSMWSKQQYSSGDFNILAISGDNKYTLSALIVNALLDNNSAIFTNGTFEKATDGTIEYSIDIRIDYLKWQLRYSLGENETTSAVSQNIREIFFRCDDQYEDVDNPANIESVCDDLDGNVKYTHIYGDKRGLYSDRFMYLMSQAADTDTTVGGQRVSKGYKVLNITDTYHVKQGGGSGDVQSEKGQLCLEVLADDPTGTNANIYGYVEIGWRYKNN